LRDRTARSEVLQTLAKKLNAPATYFDPPASGSVHQAASQPDDPERLNLMVRNLDAEGLAEMLLPPFGPEHINWRLNVHAVDDETIQFLEQLEDAINDLHTHDSPFGSDRTPKT
jgi:hypothetical protein